MTSRECSSPAILSRKPIQTLANAILPNARPRLSDRGPIEATASLVSLAAGSTHNRGYRTADPLKPDALILMGSHLVHNRGYRTADPLKLSRARSRVVFGAITAVIGPRTH